MVVATLIIWEPCKSALPYCSLLFHNIFLHLFHNKEEAFRLYLQHHAGSYQSLGEQIETNTWPFMVCNKPTSDNALVSSAVERKKTLTI